jgi:hypothetical protein
MILTALANIQPGNIGCSSEFGATEEGEGTPHDNHGQGAQDDCSSLMPGFSVKKIEVPRWP